MNEATVRLHHLLTGLIALVVVLAVVPGGLAVDRMVRNALDRRAADDLDRAVRLVEDRRAVEAGALMMHAKEIAALPDVAAALAEGRPEEAARIVSEAAAGYGEGGVLHGPAGGIGGPRLPVALVDATRDGGMPVDVMEADGRLYRVALAPVKLAGEWVATAGVVRPWDETDAAVLAGLTRTDVWILGSDGEVLATSTDDGRDLPAPAAPSAEEDGRWATADAPLGPGSIRFARDWEPDARLLAGLRRAGVAGLGGGLVLALLLGGVLASRVSRPVRALADAAEGVGREDYAAGLAPTRVRELRQVGEAFDTMRSALVRRLDELRSANAELRNRQERLAALQADLIRQDRLAASGQLVAQLAHEIRNPVANVRNCLEVVRRRTEADAEAQRFADLAVEELKRMHGLAERLLDLHRPGDAQATDASAADVAGEVAALEAIGSEDTLTVGVEGDAQLRVPMPRDALKQVLASLVQNAREAMGGRGSVTVRVRRSGSLAIIDVLDDGPGIPADVLPRVFDPFFTTKRSVQGVGLGLFVAEAVVRSHGGRLSCANRSDRSGAAFRIEIEEAVAAVDDGRRTGA